ncbi:MAG: hypothetical protein J6K39_03205 [Clostridia bacterium]|nr:hypothetical protein [Clostridia bacterium]
MKLSEMQKKAQTKQASTKNMDIRQSYEELKGCSNDELFRRLTQEIQTQKANGVFDYDGICASIEKIKMYLPKETYENMIRVIDSLK